MARYMGGYREIYDPLGHLEVEPERGGVLAVLAHLVRARCSVTARGRLTLRIRAKVRARIGLKLAVLAHHGGAL